MLKTKSYLLILFVFVIFSCSKDDDNNDPENPQVDKTANQQTLGTSARDFLTADEFISIRLEIAYVQGSKPTQTSIDGLVTFLENRCNKPANISIKETVVAPTDDDDSLDIDEIVQIENENRTVFNTG
ncbi:MAG: membrane metalloprotease, partial [Leeuwenhoekiella sp.]